MRLPILLLIFVITIINYLDRGGISFAILPIQRDLGLDDFQFGIAAAAFGVGYTLMIFFTGFLIDRFGSIKIWALSALLWSLVTFAIGLSENFAMLVALRIALGVVETAHFPAMLKTVADWLSPQWVARSLSFSLLGVPVASLIGAPLITLLIEKMGWRAMFFILAGLGVVWVLIWLLYFTGKKNPHLNRASLPVADKLKWHSFFKNKALMASCTVYFIFGYILFFGLFWIPGYLENSFHLSLTETGWLTMLPWLSSSILILIGGFVSDLLMKRSRSIRISRVYPTACALFLASLCFFLLSRSTDMRSSLLFFSLGLGFTFAINAPIYAFNADLFPNRAGTAQSISSFFFSLAGIFSPSVTGWLVQTTGHFQSAIFLVALLALLASLISFVFQKPLERLNRSN